MGLEIISIIGGIPFLPGPLERSSTVYTNSTVPVRHDYKSRDYDVYDVCLPGEINLGVLDRISASLVALPGEASPTRACLGAIAGQ